MKDFDRTITTKKYSLKDLLQIDEKVLNKLLFKTSIVIQGVFIHESHQDFTQTRIIKVQRKVISRGEQNLVMLQMMDITASLQV